MKTSAKRIGLMLPFVLIIAIAGCNNSTTKERVNDETVKQDSGKGKDPVDKPLAEKASAEKWKANAASAQIKFSVKGLIGTVHGSLTGLKSTILFDPKHLSSSAIEASVDPKSISTGNKSRNKHLQEDKYLESDQYPMISFRSDEIRKSANGFMAIGKLTIKGVTRKVEIPFQFSEKGNNGMFKGKFSIKRKDYHVGGNGGSIGNTVDIDLQVPVTHSNG